MALVVLQHPSENGEQHVSRHVTGPVTGTIYVVDPLGRMWVDERDAPNLVTAAGWLYAYHGLATSDEITQLRIEVEELRAVVAPPPPPKAPKAQTKD